MDWLTDIIKRLEVSKSLVAALFVTAAVMNFGPRFAPTEIPKVPAELAPGLFALMVLTACLLFIWGCSWAWSLITHGLKETSRALVKTSLTEAEIAIIHTLGLDPTAPLNLDNIDYSRAPGTKLEFHQLASELETKGLVYINGFDESLITLTKKGRDKALEIEREWKTKKTHK